MNRKLNILLRIAAGALGGAILVFLALFAFSFLGNPVTSFFAGQRIDTHISQNFSFLDLKKEKVFYDFKTGNYTMRVHAAGIHIFPFTTIRRQRKRAILTLLTC